VFNGLDIRIKLSVSGLYAPSS